MTFVTHGLQVGGCERHLATILPVLAQDWKIRMVLLGHEEGFFASCLKEKGIAVHRLLHHSLWGSSFWGKRPLALLTRLWKLRPWITQGITHFFLPSPYIIGMAAAYGKAHVGPLILSRRSLNTYQTPWIRRVEGHCHPRVTLAVGNSQRVVQQLMEEGLDPTRVRLIYNGINPNLFYKPQDRQAMRNHLGLREDEVIIVHVANLFPYKGHEDLLEAIHLLSGILLPSSLPFRVLCVGRDQGIREALQQKAQSLSIGHRVLWMGQRHDVPSLLSAGDMGVLCSHEEGFSNALLESMAAGLAMVVTDVGGNSEAVLHGQTGLVVPARSPHALAQALRDLLVDPKKRNLFSMNGKQRVREHFSLDACIRGYHNLYQDAFRYHRG